MNIVAALRTPRAGAVEMPPTAPVADLLIKKETRKDEKKTEFQLTDSITSSTIRTPASLRSENDQLHLGTGDRDQIGITKYLHRNKQQFLVHRSGDVGQHTRPNHLPTLSIFVVMKIGFYALLQVEEKK